MSNFYCEQCGAICAEGEDGRYITGCAHYPPDVVPLYSCKTCGLKPELSGSDALQYVCDCGVSGAKVKTEARARALWNQIAFCAQWVLE